MDLTKACDEITKIIRLINELTFIKVNVSIYPVEIVDKNISWYTKDDTLKNTPEYNLYLFKHENELYLIKNKDLGMGYIGLTHIKINNFPDFYNEILAQYINCFLDWKEFSDYSIYELNDNEKCIIKEDQKMQKFKEIHLKNRPLAEVIF